MARMKKAAGSSSRRAHIVLIPGFAGFDALGQLDYYAGVTPLFQHWARARGESPGVLHYFDNFPTAAVRTRANRLERYLAKRIARGEFQPEDRLALVGHSTGGLDIRRCLYDLASLPGRKIAVDGTEDVEAAEILDRMDRIVFLSAPQWGTNIASWVCRNVLGRALIVAELRASVAASQVPLLGRFQDWLSSSAAGLLNIDLFYAIRDALAEAEPVSRDPLRSAAAQEATALLELWLRHMGSDFHAINDLTPASLDSRCDAATASPAHFNAAERNKEAAGWAEHHILTRSYATVATRPFQFESGKPAPQWDLLKPWTWPEAATAASESAGTDIAYRYCYRACAGGPFTAGLPSERPASPRALEIWDNDGIVNTASMLWPNGPGTVVVECDHMDIVGHYRRVPAVRDTGRQYRAYDLLKSESRFDESSFAQVWTGIFDFCTAE
jgi:triacylglycerol lipase